MSMTAFSCEQNVFMHAGHIHGFAFIVTARQDNCALLPHICSDLANKQVKCAHFSRLERLLPRIG